MKTISIVVLILIIILACGYFFSGNDKNNNPSIYFSYSSEITGFKMSYPAIYEIKREYIEEGLNRKRDIVLIEKSAIPPPNTPTEGPPSITISVFEDSKDIELKNWISESKYSNFELGPQVLNEKMVASTTAYEYFWSGLYEGKSVVVKANDKIYMFSVTWLTPEDRIIKDFEKLLTSVTFIK